MATYVKPLRRGSGVSAQGRRDTDRGGRGYNGDGATYAALDLGTNNCRLLVARPSAEGFRVIDAFSRIVRLGEGVAANGTLADEAMARTIDALRVCAAKMRRRGVRHARNVATEACRRAANTGAFVERARAETGLALEVISSQEEAALALRGCAPLIDGDQPYALMFDIGGGSTELMWLAVGPQRQLKLIDWMSLPYGVVGLAEQYDEGMAPHAWYEEIAARVAAALADFEARHGILRHVADGEVQMLGSSGTVTTLAGVHMRLRRYDRSLVDGSTMDFASVEIVSRELAAMSHDERAANPCIGRERADLVVGGCAILAAICRQWPVGALRIADRGVREGILLGLMYGIGL